jgi:CRP-like cAMP-binding protein
MQTITFKAGDTIISEGDEGNTAFLIVAGSVEVSIGEGAKAKTVGSLDAGEVFGEMCLIEPGPRSATITAVTDTECVTTSYDEFMASIQESPERAIVFLKTLVGRLRQMNDRLSTDAGKGGLRRIFRDWQKSLEPRQGDDVPSLYWTMMW